MSKDTNKQAAEKLFASTTHKVLWANPKGEFFTSESFGTLSLKKGQQLEKFERPQEQEVVKVTTEKPLSAVDSIATIKEATSLEALVPFEADTRTTVIAAYNEQHAKLLAEIEVAGTTDVTKEGTEGDATEGQQ